MYNFVDTYFAGLVSVSATAALTFSFPVFFIIVALGNGLGQGVTGLMANALGSGDSERGRRIFCQALLLTGLLTLVLTIAGLVGAKSLFVIQGAKGEALELSMQYIVVIIWGAGFFLLQTVLNAELNSAGNTKVYRNSLIAGFFANCILDPWFMYGGVGVPAMGVAGLALATIICQIGTCVYMFWCIRSGTLWHGVTAMHFRPDAKLVRQIVGQSIPAAFNMLTVAVGIFVIQFFIAKFSQDAVAAYGIATRVEQMLLLPTMGLNFAVISLVGQNNGAGRMDRVRETWNTTLKYGVSMMLAGGVVLWFTREWLMGWFTKSEAVVQHGKEYLGIAAITLCSYVILFQTVMLLQGLKRPAFAMWIGLYRQILAPFTVFYMLAITFGWGVWGVWWGITVVTWSAALVTFGYGKWLLSKISHQASLIPSPDTIAK